MTVSLLLSDKWDLGVDDVGNIALAGEQLSVAQDVATACRLFSGELHYDTAAGIPYFEDILGHSPSQSLLRAKYVAAARRVPAVLKAVANVYYGHDRVLRGHVKVTDQNGVNHGVTL